MNDHGGTILQYQDNQAQTNFWSQFVAEANQLNNTLDGIANGTVNPTNSEIQSLITEINNYNEFGETFTGSQGGVFGDRFDNELISGTLKTDSANAVAGLQSIDRRQASTQPTLHNWWQGAWVLWQTRTMCPATTFQPVADRMSVTRSTVPGATTTAAATVGTVAPVSGAVDGNDNPTNTPVNALTNDGFGASNPNPNGDSNEGGQKRHERWCRWSV